LCDQKTMLSWFRVQAEALPESEEVVRIVVSLLGLDLGLIPVPNHRARFPHFMHQAPPAPKAKASKMVVQLEVRQ
jgi:hypothetical protein